MEQNTEEVMRYVTRNPNSTNVQLFSMLALLRAYVPESFLLMTECQQVLGPPDPIHGVPFRERMAPFTGFKTKSGPTPGDVHVSMIDQMCAQRAVSLLARLRISRSSIVEKLLSLCGDEPQPHLIQFIKDLLTKREMEGRGKTKFSRLIEDIKKHEDFDQAVSVLKRASRIFNMNPNFPQTVSRLLYIAKDHPDLETAKYFALRAIERAPLNSYMADTLGQVYKNHLRQKLKGSEEVLQMTKMALNAFNKEEKKAEREVGPEMADEEGTLSISDSFNNRGLFGFIQVANLAFNKLPEEERRMFIQDKKKEVEVKFDFFEWYLTYSKPDKTTSEPHYFWKDVALCYKNYTSRTSAGSSSFPGLLRLLNHGLFIFEETCAEFEENEKTVSDLEAVQCFLKNTYEENVDDVKAAERYILSNIILSNRKPRSPQLTLMRDLQTIIHRFLVSEERHRSPEFYLLVLLLFWPDEEVVQQATEDSTSEDKKQDTRGEPSLQPLNPMVQPDLQRYITFMEKAYQREYANYLRGRYLVPLFFLGKGSGLSKWIHKSKLDTIVERKVDAELAEEQDDRYEMKMKRINNMWINGEVWQVPEIQDILLPVQVERFYSDTMSHEHEEEKMFVCVGGQKIVASAEVELDAPVIPQLFYLGFNIRGPVLFKVGLPVMLS